MNNPYPSSCPCVTPALHDGRRVVLTGGPGAGKTAVLEVARRQFCQHVVVLPEAASIVFGGGFPRLESEGGRVAAQRAIYHVQRELEALPQGATPSAVTLCDRGLVDCAAYWPGELDDFFREVGTTREAALARYAAVLHLRTPPATGGYNHRNALRIETAEEAQRIDARIVRAWEGHPRRFFVEPTDDFVEKLARTLELFRAELPACCRGPLAAPDGRSL